MIVELYIKDILIDLYSDATIKNTIQANDVSQVSDRQSSYTDKFSAPKTAKNIRTFEGLGINSDTSSIPYNKLDCQLKYDGFDFIIDGWAVVSETSDEFDIYIYSGIIDFFKAIENKTIGSDLDLSEIDHSKDLATVAASQFNSNYRYFLADYGGKTHFTTGGNKYINIDYMVPSVNRKYLWDKIFNTFGFTYSGSVFDNVRFTNAWITYPKGIIDAPYTSVNVNTGSDYVEQPYLTNNYYFGFTGNFVITETATYRLYNVFNLSTTNPSGTQPLLIEIEKNGSVIYSYTSSAGSTTATIDLTTPLNIGDDIRIKFTYLSLGFIRLTLSWNFEIFKYSAGNISFTEELQDFSITSFVKSILNEYGLTAFADKYSNNIEFLTIKERVQSLTVIDWSDKYIERTSENYIYGNYAQRNIFKYKYNEDESDYNDGAININNLNLAESKDVFSSVFYSPEKGLLDFEITDTSGSVTKSVNYFKMFEKEINDNDGVQEIKYKGLEKRFNLMRSNPISETIRIGSEITSTTTTSNNLSLGEFSYFDFETIIAENYSEFGKLLNESKIHEIDLNINLIDMINLDLKSLYFFEQEQQYYFLNKIVWNGSNSATGEFIRVKYYE